MSNEAASVAPERLAVLGRALVECRRFASPDQEDLSTDWEQRIAPLETQQRRESLRRIEPLLRPSSQSAKVASEPATEGDGKGPIQELQRQRANLELKLKGEAERVAELERLLARERETSRQATETLGLQQRKLKDLQDDRAKLLAEASQLETQVREQISHTEQAELKLEKLRGSRQSLGDQATELTEQINNLKAENERIRQELAQALHERDQRVASAQEAVQQAESLTADAVFQELWTGMRDELPNLFVETHVPTRRTFESLCDALAEFARVFMFLEMHVHHFLKDLKQGNDGLTHFYSFLTRNPGLVDTLRTYLVSGKGRNNFKNVLRANQAWVQAFGTGFYKVLVRSPALIKEELNWRNWPLQKSFTVTEEVACGRYFISTANKTIPDKLGTEFRKLAGDGAFEDYNNFMKSGK